MLPCFSDLVIQSINISTIALEASATGKENSHQKRDKKTAINNAVMSHFIQIFHDQQLRKSEFAVVGMQNFGQKTWLLVAKFNDIFSGPHFRLPRFDSPLTTPSEVKIMAAAYYL